MTSSKLPHITSRTDIENIEKIPLSERNLAENTYAVFGRSAKLYGDKIALRFLFAGTVEEQAINYSYNEFYKLVAQTANGLQQLGVGHKDVVSILLPNLPQNHFALWGAEAVGIANPINPLLSATHIISIMNATKAKVLVTLAPFPNNNLWDKAQEIAQQVPSLETILTVNLAQFLPADKQTTVDTAKHTTVNVLNFDNYICTQASEFTCNKASQDIACYFHTGGTTGAPKVAMHSHGNQVFSAWMVGQQLDWSEKGVMHCGLPLFHVNAPLISGLAPFTVGGEVILTSPQGFRSPVVLANFWRLVEKYKISFLMAVPTVYVELNKRWDDSIDTSSLQVAACGAAPMPTTLITEFTERTKIRLIEGYGLTEGTVFSCVNPFFGHSKLGSIGLRIPYQAMQAVILDTQGKLQRRCHPGETGTLVIRGPNVFLGYLRVEDNSQAWLQDGWLNTGDLGQEDEDGYFKISGRSKDLIIRGGHNIDPQIIEEALNQHPAIAMTAAVGKPDARLGEVPVAFVTLREGQTVSAQELRDFAATTISEHVALPTNIYIIDAMPLTAVGKIYKPDLRTKVLE